MSKMTIAIDDISDELLDEYIMIEVRSEFFDFQFKNGAISNFIMLDIGPKQFKKMFPGYKLLPRGNMLGGH